jgi:large-conductance mechanosensitive channel
VILVSNFIYSDIVEYLKLRDKLEYLDYILPLKWVLNISLFSLIVYLLLGIFKSKEKKEEVEERSKELSKEDIILEEFKDKVLKSKGDLIIEKKLKNR